MYMCCVWRFFAYVSVNVGKKMLDSIYAETGGQSLFATCILCLMCVYLCVLLWGRTYHDTSESISVNRTNGAHRPARACGQ